MAKFWLILIVAILLAIGVGAIYLLNIDLEPPRENTEKTLPDDMFPK